MGSKRFEAFLDAQTAHAPSVSIDWDAVRDRWLDCVDRFYKTVESVLRPYVDEGKIALRYGTKQLHEEYMGQYEARVALISIGGKHLRLEPIGTNLLGAKGRIDLLGPHGRIRFVLVDKKSAALRILVREVDGEDDATGPVTHEDAAEFEWRIATDPPNVSLLPFSEESFLDALMAVADGQES